MKLYTQMIGGIGDILLAMMKPGSPLGYFRALKARGDTTMAVAHANTDESYRLFERLPYVDHLRFRGRSLKIDTAPDQHFDLLKRYDAEWERPRLALDAEEAAELADIRTEPYVAVHVSASLPEKIPPDAVKLLAGLRDAGVRTVVLGCEASDDSYGVAGNRAPGFRAVLRDYPEHIWLPPKLRLHVAAAMYADKFIGTLSCFNCAAQVAGVRSFVIVNRSLQEPNVYGMMHRNNAVIRPWNVGQPVEKIYRDAVEWASL